MIYRRGRKVKSLIKEKGSGKIWEDSQVGKVGYGDHRSPASLFRFAQNDRKGAQHRRKGVKNSWKLSIAGRLTGLHNGRSEWQEDVPGMPGRGDREMMINGGNR